MKSKNLLKNRIRDIVKQSVYEVNDELADADEQALWLQSRNVAKVMIRNEDMPKAKVYKIKRQDIRRYHQLIMTGWGQLGSLSGDWRPIMYIKEDVKAVFERLDRKLKEKGIRI
jgi:hypothetical protein